MNTCSVYLHSVLDVCVFRWGYLHACVESECREALDMVYRFLFSEFVIRFLLTTKKVCAALFSALFSKILFGSLHVYPDKKTKKSKPTLHPGWMKCGTLDPNTRLPLSVYRRTHTRKHTRNHTQKHAVSSASLQCPLFAYPPCPVIHVFALHPPPSPPLDK